MSYSSWGPKESDTTERLSTHTQAGLRGFCTESLKAPVWSSPTDIRLNKHSFLMGYKLSGIDRKDTRFRELTNRQRLQISFLILPSTPCVTLSF